MPDNTSLSQRAYDRVTALFESNNRKHSHDQADAVRDLIDHLALAVDGALPERKAFVSSIPPGTGKSLSIATFTNVLLDDRAYDYCGVLILVSRIAEAITMADQLKAHRARLCVSTSDAEANDMGDIDKKAARTAQVVVTTQEAIRRAIRWAKRDRVEINLMLFGKERRKVVAWDEQLSFRRPIVMVPRTGMDLLSCFHDQAAAPFIKVGDKVDAAGNVVRKAPPIEEQKAAHAKRCDDWRRDAHALYRWATRIETCDEDYTTIPTPAMRSNMQALEDAVEDDPRRLESVQALRIIEGESARLIRQGQRMTLVTHVSELPYDVLPLIVTDASAYLNPAYDRMSDRVVRLKVAHKDYGNLIVRKVPVAASRSVFNGKNKRKEANALIDLAARYIRSVPAEQPVLVVSYVGAFSVLGRLTPVEAKRYGTGLAFRTIEQAIRFKLGLDSPDDTRLNVLSYGKHKATNAFEHVRHILLLGLNYLGDAHYTAAAGAANQMSMTEDEVPSDDEVAAFREGMLMDDTMQAVLRGAARGGSHGLCGECEVVAVASDRHGLSNAAWKQMFPGCNPVADTVLVPKRTKPSGKLMAVQTIIQERIQAGAIEIRLADIYGVLKMAHGNFLRLLKENRPEWASWLDAQGLLECRLSRGALGLRRR